MPEKEWKIYLDEETYLVVERHTMKGILISFKIVLIHKSICISRYDCTHGFPHKDVLGQKSGLLLKQSLTTLPLHEAFEKAMLDFKKNWRTEIEFYFSR